MTIKMLNRADSNIVIFEIGHENEKDGYAGLPVNIAAAEVNDWNRELSPWRADKCFKGGEDFAGEAEAYLESLLSAIPAFEEENGIKDPVRGIIGYSLAGLFCLWAAQRTEMISMAASVSGSLWFDGWKEYIAEHGASYKGKRIYLSVGDREKKTRNALLASVEDNMYFTRDILIASGAEVMCELNEGGHFVKDNKRMLKAIDWLCS